MTIRLMIADDQAMVRAGFAALLDVQSDIEVVADAEDGAAAVAAARRQRVSAEDAPPEDVVATVRVVASGKALLAPSVTRRLIEEFFARPTEPVRPSMLESLTARETEVLRLVARGMSNTDVATHLVVSVQTVKTHVGKIFAKLGLRDRAQAVICAHESGLVAAGDPR